MINYDYVANAIFYYKGLGYKYMNAPWFVSRETMEVTAPPDRRYCSSFLGDLVASGEQSFIEMHKQGKLPKGLHQCATPCFRDEPVVDHIHKNYFFKVELIDVMPQDPGRSLSRMIDDALFLFRQVLPNAEVVNGDVYGVTDIQAEGLELGSYGIRGHGNFTWVYGTGLAEPRFSQAVARMDITVMENLIALKKEEINAV